MVLLIGVLLNILFQLLTKIKVNYWINSCFFKKITEFKN